MGRNHKAENESGLWVEAAYRRPNLFERRYDFMEQWAAFLTGTEDKVARLHG